MFLCVCVCPVCKTALILIDLNCGRAIYIEAPESQSMQHGPKCKHFSETDWYPNHRTVTRQVRAVHANLTRCVCMYMIMYD